MKHFFLGITALIFFFSGSFHANAENVSARANDRELVLFWKDENVFGRGLHRPYANLKLETKEGSLLWEGKATARGTFEFTVPRGKIDPGTAHLVTLRAFDEFGRELMKGKDTPDQIEAMLPAGLQTRGKTDPGAKITLLNSEGKILNTYTSDTLGNYTIPNAPEGSTVRIQKDENVFETEFQEGTLAPKYFEQENPDLSEPVHSAAPEIEEKKSSGLFFEIMLGILIIGSAGGGVFFFFQKRHQNIS